MKDAFGNASICPVNMQKVLEKMAKYIKEATPEPPVLPTLLLP